MFLFYVHGKQLWSYPTTARLESAEAKTKVCGWTGYRTRAPESDALQAALRGPASGSEYKFPQCEKK